jgi:hypothetical protein
MGCDWKDPETHQHAVLLRMSWLYFIAVQVISLALTAIGWVILLPLALLRQWTYDPNTDRLHWRWKLLWLWDNSEDGLTPFWYLPNSDIRLRVYLWTAWRNSVGNFRFIPGVSRKSGPFYRIVRKGWYFQAGFRPDHGWPVLSAGRVPNGGFDYGEA